MSTILLGQQSARLALPVTLPGRPSDGTLPGPDGPWSRSDLIKLIVRKADEHSLVPWEFLGLSIAEGLNPRAARPVAQEDWRRYWEPPEPRFDVSFGLGQKNVRYSDEYAAWCRSHGINPESEAADAYPGDDVIASIRDAYFNPYHALDVAARGYKYWRYNPEVPYLTAASAYNGPSYYHTPEANANYSNYAASGEEAREILGLIESPIEWRLFSDDVPDILIRQQNNWTCSVRSVFAGLWQLGQMGRYPPVTYGDGGPRDVYDWMVPEYANSEWGLLLHTGAGMVEMLRYHGYSAGNLYPCSLPDVQARAGRQPVMLGGKSWNHWTYVNGVESDGTLILENPMPGWAGIYDQLRDSFARLGDDQGHMSMVWIDV